MSKKTTMHPLAVLVGLTLAMGSASPASAQWAGDPDESYVASTHLAVGYVANAPDQLVGFSAMTVGSLWSGWGLYIDVKFTPNSPEGDDEFDATMTAAEAESLGDLTFGNPDRIWTTVNAAVVRAVADEVAVYAGAGHSREKVYQEYEDPDGERGIQGFYIVEDERLSRKTVNLLGGLFFRAGRHFSFQIGAETAPAGFTAGVGLVFPLGG